MSMVLTERRGSVTILTLNNPAQYNALAGSLLGDLSQAIDAAIADASVRAMMLTGAGKGIKVANGARSSMTVSAPGSVRLMIKARGRKKKKKLNTTGVVKVKPKITYTPTGGEPATRSVRLKLKKKL